MEVTTTYTFDQETIEKLARDGEWPDDGYLYERLAETMQAAIDLFISTIEG